MPDDRRILHTHRWEWKVKEKQGLPDKCLTVETGLDLQLLCSECMYRVSRRSSPFAGSAGVHLGSQRLRNGVTNGKAYVALVDQKSGRATLI